MGIHSRSGSSITAYTWAAKLFSKLEDGGWEELAEGPNPLGRLLRHVPKNNPDPAVVNDAYAALDAGSRVRLLRALCELRLEAGTPDLRLRVEAAMQPPPRGDVRFPSNPPPLFVLFLRNENKIKKKNTLQEDHNNGSRSVLHYSLPVCGILNLPPPARRRRRTVTHLLRWWRRFRFHGLFVCPPRPHLSSLSQSYIPGCFAPVGDALLTVLARGPPSNDVFGIIKSRLCTASELAAFQFDVGFDITPILHFGPRDLAYCAPPPPPGILEQDPPYAPDTKRRAEYAM